MRRTHAILLAGGDGNRFGADIPKQFVRLAGEQILARSLRTIAAAGVARIVVVANRNWVPETEALVASEDVGVPVTVVVGGATRNESTRNGLDSLVDVADDDAVLVHDAVRPLVPLDVVRRAIEPVVAGRAEAADTVIPSADTLVIVAGEQVIEIPDRARFRRGQTPQVFRHDVLVRAFDGAEAAHDLTATDDCTLVLRYVPGARIEAVDGDEVNLKITTRIDLVLADRMIQMRTLVPSDQPPSLRTMEGARVLVVGGTNGIGRAIADEAARAGASVEVDGRSRGLDVRDPNAVAERLAAVAARLGGVDHVVVTAGVLLVGPVSDTTPASLAEVVDVNLTGTLNVARAAYPHLSRSRGSLTVFTSSSFTRGRPDYVAYSASKAGVANLAQGLAEEWAAEGIRVNAVSPERTDTPMRRRAFPDESTSGMLTADEVAIATIALLRSDLTGQVVDVKRHDALAAAAMDVADTVSALPD
ncbi:MAG TPA: bifunctional cytidylyltransferase/SDR family oxidoreductase [Candidatus Limnocylindrales bacterium]